MAVLTKGSLSIDYADEGQGQVVVLIHSSVSANRQWRALTEALQDRYRVLAINLFGYGETTPWPGSAHQTLDAQAQLVRALVEDAIVEDTGGPVHLVGHSLGGSVALKAARLLGARAGGPHVDKLVLLEPNPVSLLRQEGRKQAYAEVLRLRDQVKPLEASGNWPAAAQHFVDYWSGEGAWSKMPEKRQAAFARALPPNFYEWEAVMGDETPLEDWCALPARTLVVSDPATQLPIREIVKLFAQACSHWSFRSIAGVGHMAPLTHPELVNPVIREFLDWGSA